MSFGRMSFVAFCTLTLVASAACSNSKIQNQHVDISRIFSVKSTFGPDYKVTTSGPMPIDPRLLAAPRFSQDMTFDPADCSKFASGQMLPQGLKGRMATVSAEGNNNRFIAVAVETSQQVPYEPIGDNCHHIAFNSQSVKGVVDVIDAPHIEAAQTLAIHRVLDATVGGQHRSGELYNYTVYLGHYLVLVAANPLVVPNQPPVSVDLDQARKLLTDSVAAVRG